MDSSFDILKQLSINTVVLLTNITNLHTHYLHYLRDYLATGDAIYGRGLRKYNTSLVDRATAI